jgi:hypothetical protein
LPSPPPLETARAPFNACSLSLANAPRRTRCVSTKPAHLHDTPPEPLLVAQGGRTSRRCRCRHLLCLRQRLAELSRAARPEGSLLPGGWGAVAHAQPLSAPLQSGVRFFPPLLPAAASRSLARPLPTGTATGLPRSAGVPRWVRPRLFAGGSTAASGKFGVPEPGHVPFGPSLSASLAGHN